MVSSLVDDEGLGIRFGAESNPQHQMGIELMPARNDTFFRHLKPGEEKDYKRADTGGLFMLVTTNGVEALALRVSVRTLGYTIE